MMASRARSFLIAIATAVTLVASATESLAIPVTVPTSLSPGAQYRLAFVTSTTRDASSSNIADYNAFVTGVANAVSQLSALGATWTAIGSTNAVAARDNTSTNPGVDGTGVPIFLLDDTLLATGNADLWDGSITNPLRIDQTGTLVVGGGSASFVWTGSNVSGTQAGFNLNLGNGTPFHGNITSTSSGWIAANNLSSLNSFHLYAISSTLTVIPEPGTAALLALGLIALGVARRNV